MVSLLPGSSCSAVVVRLVVAAGISLVALETLRDATEQTGAFITQPGFVGSGSGPAELQPSGLHVVG